MAKRQNIQKRKKSHYVEIDTPDEPQSNEKKINQYRCKNCHGVITTIQEGEALNGTTPMMLACRVTDGCNGTMFSSMYRVSQDLVPDYEWYQPAKLPSDPAMRQYVDMGGLMIRKIDSL